MSTNCPYIYDTNGIRHASGQVFVRRVDVDGSQLIMAVRSDVPRGERTPYTTSEGVDVDGSIGLEELDVTQAGFIVVDGEEIAIGLERASTQGRKGRNKFDADVFARLRGELGADAVRALAERSLSTLPGVLNDEEIGESRLWARDLLVAASTEVEGGLLGVLREYPGAVRLLATTQTRMDAQRAAERVAAALKTYPNVARLTTAAPTPGAELADLSNSSDPLMRSAYRTLSGDKVSLLQGVLSLEPVEARSALLKLGGAVPTVLLEAVLDSDHSNLVKVAAFYALLEASPELASSRALGVLSNAKHEQPMSNETTRLCEVAIGALPEALRVRLATDTTAPWLWQKVAVSSLPYTEASSTVHAVCESRQSHPLARIAAVGRCADEGVLSRVAAGADRRLSAIATERLMAVQGEERPARVARLLDAKLPDADQMRLVAIDIDGTFAADDDSVPLRNTKGVRQFADRGGVVTFTTTRSAEYALPVAREALDGRDGYLVCDDGSTIIDVNSGVTLRGPTPLGENTPGGAARAGDLWVLAATADTTMETAANLARELSGPRGVVVLEKVGRSGWGMRHGTDKGTTLEDVATFAGVPLSQCCVFGDGKVDLPMFEKVRTAGGVVVAVGNAQPGVDAHPSVSLHTLSNNEGGVGFVLEALSEGSWPEMEDGEAQKFSFTEEVYSQYAVLEPSALAEALREEGLEHLVGYRPGSDFHGATWCQPGHVTFAHPNDFKGSEMPTITDAELRVVGYIDTEAVTALVCSVDDGEGATTTRPDGKTYHITLRTQVGVPPVHSNVVIAEGWTALADPVPFNTTAIRQRRRKG